MDRKCKKCDYVGPVESFPSAGVVKGVDYYRHQCNPCYTKMKADRRRHLKEQYHEYKSQLVCSQCGFDDWRALQFHHHNGDKEFNVSDMLRWAMSFRRIKEEMEKCTPLCANCHVILHHEEHNGTQRDVAQK